ncbi:LysR family transcriptional regulator [Aureimonas populi]|uniref:LysR family transcriptional regulator n=1 Tax=Aureimonas populi TaxID=1701758 RepID=A0ABW5CJB3_9HYPH|nr:LysR family transcriptional regulator [Aureimonas populi]
MHSLDDFAYFAAVVRNRGFAAASRDTGVPKSKLSRRVRELEDRIGARLLERSTRRFEVTEVGEAFYKHCENALAEVRAAEEVAQFYVGEPRGLLRVSTPPGLCVDAVAAVLPGFLADYPQARVQLSVGMRRVDIIAERIDIAVRVRTRLDTDADMMIKRVAQLSSIVVASPAFLERHGPISSLADLARLPTIGNNNAAPESWLLSARDGSTRTVTHEPVVASNDLHLNRLSALSGVGVALLPEEVIRADLDAGRLVNALPGWNGEGGVLHLLFTSRRGMLPLVRIFLDRLAQSLSDIFQTNR